MEVVSGDGHHPRIFPISLQQVAAENKEIRRGQAVVLQDYPALHPAEEPAYGPADRFFQAHILFIEQGLDRASPVGGLGVLPDPGHLFGVLNNPLPRSVHRQKQALDPVLP